MSAAALQGRVFDRVRHFQTLAAAIQEQANSISPVVVSNEVLSQQCVSLLCSAYGVKANVLVDFVMKKLELSKRAEAEAIVDALVLKGVVTPHTEGPATAKQLNGFATSNYVLVPGKAKDSGKPEQTSVWDVQEGAIQAGTLKRRCTSKIFGSCSKDAYIVLNDQTKSLYVFDSDIARQLNVQMDLSAASVQFDASIEHGIKITNATTTEVLAADSKEKQEEWLNSVINAGASYREAYNLDAESVKSLYDLKDYDMQGNEIPMSKYKGKVVLVVNVSSLCGLTPTNYPELAALDQKYRDQGLEILAFPCNQFASQEPGTHEEIMEFVKQYNCKFQFFEKRDVNGKNARPVFTYLKAKLPGSWGSFVKWNFTKFLVDRNGQPYKRFAPKDLPFSFENDIKALLAQKPSAL